MNARLFSALFLLLCATAVAARDESRLIELPSGTLLQSLPLLGRQAGISISVADAKLWQRTVKPVRGRMSVQKALDRLLSGTDAHAVRVGTTSWRIERRASRTQHANRQARSTRKIRRASAQATPSAEEQRPVQEIVVNASKIDMPYVNYAGVVTILDGADLQFGGERGMDSILSRMATISSTHLGSGRNKLFIRGIADSSFTGPTQATVGQYLGDIRLSYNAPDPDLRLYDIDRVEILEGPQGTLYGAGSLGGIIRMIPKTPDPDETTLVASAGVSLVQHGAPGGDISATANIPVGDSGHALRLVGYSISDGGYIDNPLLGLNDVNRTNIRGGRGTLRLDLGDNWAVDFGGIYQSIKADDAQYADKNAPPLTRSSLVEQGANARYGSAMLVVMKNWDNLHFQSSNAYVDHNLYERFDASLVGDTPRVFEQRNATRMLTSETRLSRPYSNGLGWVVGTSFIDNRTRQTRDFGGENMRAAIVGVTNRITEYTAYGEMSLELLPDIVATGGLRYTHARLGGDGEDVDALFALTQVGRAITAKRNEQDLLPSASLLANLGKNITFYARYQEGFRPGGLSIDGSFVQRFRNDHVSTYDAGMRFGRKGVTPLDATISISHSRWRDIQADYIDTNGFPTTANIGDGKITSISGSIAVRPVTGLSLEMGAVYNKSRVTQLSTGLQLAGATLAGPPTDFLSSVPVSAVGRLGRIPNVASHAVRGSANYETVIGDEDFRLQGWASYIGPSRVGIGPQLGEGQGDYLDSGLAARIGNDSRGITLSMTNLLDSRGNRFALGTPFVPGSEGYLTPLRPRTLRIAVDVAY
ncbi:TonB-dependent receptor domain-containing protein [Sphingorhabdus sp. SMR4y]|uniref:TonB-dependent receptor domain-containing protein n=1 Tax=Sphingorhabdus sp. SMR4y TaxID=2584094 RepID=UPI000B5CD8B5|nr:TonB-dependent receptor [Sphingorhabdus sp. SMR4y]ASK89853.1 pesticin receptor [Sphingorhabdus sp. SMR4y]